MATHCSTLAWKIPWTEESRRLQSMDMTEQLNLKSEVSGKKGVKHDSSFALNKWVNDRAFYYDREECGGADWGIYGKNQDFFLWGVLGLKYLVEIQGVMFSRKLNIQVWTSGEEIGAGNKKNSDYISISINIYLQHNFFVVDSCSILLMCAILCDE